MSAIHIVPVSLSSARALLARHYAAGAPARVCLTLGATIGSRLVGVLTVSYPTLNARWRKQAWPGEYDGPCKRENARRLNADVRRISRVVVHPRHRSRGIATALVRAYLRRPLTERTEVVAAMGEFCGCFEAAGMKRVECRMTARDVRLRAALRRLRVPVERLVDEGFVERLKRASGGESRRESVALRCRRPRERDRRAHPLPSLPSGRGIRREPPFPQPLPSGKGLRSGAIVELWKWANAAGATRKFLRGEKARGPQGWLDQIAPMAAHAIAGPLRVFVAGPPPARRLATSPAGSGGGESESVVG